MQDDDHLRVYGKDLVDQTVLALWQTHMCTVVSFRFKTVRKTCEDNDLVCGFGSFQGFFCKRRVVNIIISRETFGISNIWIAGNRI